MQTKTALVIIDLQNARNDDQSDYYVWNLKDLTSKTNYLINYARNMWYKIIFTKHIEEEWDFADHNINSHIMDWIEKSSTDIIINKRKISSFYKTDMEEQLNWVENIVVCGILTNLCVRSFVQDAYDREFKIVIIKDCCAAFDKKTHEFTLEDLKRTREEIDILDLEAFLE
jgi:nicotinamidase-related amidase